MSLSLTVFKHIFDNTTARTLSFPSWEKFEKCLYGLSKMDGYKPQKDVKIPSGVVPSPLISPARYKPGTTRSIKNVLEWSGWACIDVDNYDESFEKVVGRFNKYTYVCYSTASSTKEHPKFRVVFPLTRNISVDDIPHFWFALNKEFGCIVDEQTKDVTRMFYVPAKYPGAHNFIFSNIGEEIEPSVIMASHTYIKKAKSPWDDLPEEVRKELIAHHRKKFTNTDIRWTSYKDCPFVSKRMVLEYNSLSANWYSKSYKMMCAIACNALKNGYPILGKEIADLFREIDQDTGNWYANRPLELEAERALEYAMKVTVT